MRSLQDTSVQFIKGVGPARAKLFAQLGVESVEDLLYFFPRRYDDRTKMTTIPQLRIGETQTVTGTVLAGGGRRTWFNRKYVFEAVIGDEQGKISCVWFNQPYLDKYLQMGKQLVLHGKVDLYKNRLQMIAPEYEVIDPDDETLSVGRIVPVYSLTRGMSQRYLRKVIKACLERYGSELRDFLPEYLRQNHNLRSLNQSITNIHFPEDFQAQEQALKRISFEEFFFFQVSVRLRRLSLVAKEGFAHKISEPFVQKFSSAFPFTLTGAQKKVIAEIADDLKKPSPMLRLLQGDVGSGKTLVALFGCVTAVQNGFQSAIMAPTEILARQHFDKIQSLLAGGPFSKIRIAFLVSNLPKEDKEKVLKALKNGEIDMVVGTHALLQEDVVFKKLSFVVVDEQHKFGIRQRSLLSAKGFNPDVLIMTATPIPRTLCLTLYGDLDVSVLNELPPGRGKIQTKFMSVERAEEMYKLIKEYVKKGRQAFVVYPLVEESEKLELKAAVERFKYFEKEIFKDCRVGLVHGQLKRKETEAVMHKFKNKQIDVLVATTVVEVGVDIPDANLMVIEHAERFGLAQLHQLRGRIGRGKENAHCFLIGDPQTEDSQARIKAMLATTDGFKIAEMDLLIRGPGQFFGRHQHGLNELKVANPVTQLDILELARKEAIELTKIDPRLESKDNLLIKGIIQKRYPTYLSMVEAG